MHKESYYYLFPFEMVGAGEDIIIYGGGRVGQWFLSQVQESHYANVVAIADEAYDRYVGFDVPLINPEDIPKFNFDKVIIAIDNKISARNVLETLIDEYNIDSEKIVLGKCYKKVIPEIKVSRPILETKYIPAYQLPKGISAAIWIGGSLGDNIIFKRKIDEIMKMYDNLCIDLYTLPDFGTWIRSIYGDDAYDGRLNAIVDYGSQLYESEKKKYVFALYRGIDLSLDCLDECCLPSNAKPLNDCLQTLDKRIDEHNCWQTTDMAIHYALCAKRGLNAYSSANRDGGLQIRDYHTHIPINPAFKEQYEALNLRRYITISAGFDRAEKTKELQTKCWPLGKFSKLIQMIKSSYPDIEILQTDGKITKLLGCDKYFMGEDIELVKYILRGSLLHISIEGGLVHLASQLDTKCIVLFGPTPLEYYGYDGNINIQAGNCHNCLWLEPNNHYKCSRNLETPACMESITPELVYDAVQTYLNDVL